MTVMEEVVTEMENVRVDTRDSWIQWWWMWLFERWTWWWYGGGGCGYRSGGCGGYGYEGDGFFSKNNVDERKTDLLRFNNSGSNLRPMKIYCTGHAEFRSKSVGRRRIWLFDSTFLPLVEFWNRYGSRLDSCILIEYHIKSFNEPPH
ncbi:hypothetical protein YC2023_085245 [Brassica napus]